MGKLFISSVRMLYRDKQTLFWAMVFPVIFAIVFGLFDFTDSPEARFDLVTEQPSAVSQALRSGLGRTESFTVTQGRDLTAARRRLAEGETDIVLAVPAVRGGDTAPLQIFYNSGNFDVNQFAIGAVERIVNALNLRMAGIASPPLAIHQTAMQGKTVDYYDFLLPGLVAMGVMNFSIVGMGVAIARFREQRILKRILATPLAPVKFLSAQVLARLLLALAQAALILAVGVFLFGAHIYGNVLWILLLAVVANLVFLNIGFAVAGRASNPDAAQGLGQAVALPMMFLSGVFFPTDTLPNVLRTVVEYLPLTPLIEALRKISVDGESIASTGPQLGLLGVWAIVSFFLASRSFRFART